MSLAYACRSHSDVKFCEDDQVRRPPTAPASSNQCPINAEETSMPKLRVHNFAISLDGYAAGPNQSVDNPLGVGGTRLHEWAFATRSGRQMNGMDGGDAGLDDDFVARGDVGVGATIMGRNMFGPIRGPWAASNGLAGGEKTRRTTIRCSCSPTITETPSRPHELLACVV
jgi:hypothetical protein